MTQARLIQDLNKLSAALSGSRISMPNAATSRNVDITYNGESNFPMMAGGWLFSLEAVAQVGRAMFGDTWDRTEFNSLHWPTAPLDAYNMDLKIQRRNVEVRQNIPVSIASPDFAGPKSQEDFAKQKEADLQKIDAALEATLSARVSANFC